MAASLHVSVISPERTVYEGAAEMVIAPAWDGQIGILHGHAPLLALLGSGSLLITVGGTEKSFLVEGGFLQVENDIVTVLSEQASAG